MQETYSNEQSDSHEQHTILWGKRNSKKEAAGKKSLNPADHVNATQAN